MNTEIYVKRTMIKKKSISFRISKFGSFSVQRHPYTVDQLRQRTSKSEQGGHQTMWVPHSDLRD